MKKEIWHQTSHSVHLSFLLVVLIKLSADRPCGQEKGPPSTHIPTVSAQASLVKDSNPREDSYCLSLGQVFPQIHCSFQEQGNMGFLEAQTMKRPPAVQETQA